MAKKSIFDQNEHEVTGSFMEKWCGTRRRLCRGERERALGQVLGSTHKILWQSNRTHKAQRAEQAMAIASTSRMTSASGVAENHRWGTGSENAHWLKCW